MMNDVPPKETNEPRTPVSGPGNLLTDARLKLGLEPKNVAEMLHLREHQVRALEADDYDNLPEPTYVKGYLRAYCQLLSLDSDSIVKQYSDFVTPPVKESFEGLATERQAVSNDNLVKLVSVGMIAVIGGLALVYWLSQEDSPREIAPMVQASTMVEPAQEQDGTGEPVEGIGGTGAASAPQAPMPGTDPADSGQMTDKPVVNPEPKQQRATDAATINVSPAQQQQVPPVNTPEPGPVSSAGLQSEVSLLPDEDNTVRTRLVIKVVEGSWVDIRDARGNKLIYETVPAGREIPLEGLAPLSVFLGNAQGVEVLVEDNPFDFSNFRRGLTARFKIERPVGNR